MDKTYQPQSIEHKWSAEWEKAKAFVPTGDGKPYCIVIPPPNVTGTLHMGHGFQVALQDALIRYHRMLGDYTLWQVGMDHAGIATQMVVERRLAQQSKRRVDMGRDEFEKEIWAWVEYSSEHIRGQLKRLGASVDWERERFTMDSDLSKAVNHVFVELYKRGLLYRGKRLVNWDTKLRTALSDLEVENHEEEGSLWYFEYPLTDGTGSITIATTRPETMLGDTAVAVHPDDERYKNLIGKTVTLPLVNREIPIVGDIEVDPEFGTGCVKITPAHDFNDYRMGKRHDLPMINILTDDGHLNDDVPEKYRGLERFEARKVVLADLEAEGRLVKTDKHSLKVPRGDRSGTVVEPYLTYQWFVKADTLAAAAKKAADNGDFEFVPGNWINTYNQWLENIEDWCVSRQLWWGHRIPAWFDEEGNVYVAENEAEARKQNNLSDDIKLTQDDDVLDTWFSSALWPFATQGWPENTENYKKFYPTQVLVTGFDIIFFWVARMVMMGIEFTDQVPFEDVYITGLIRDGHGQKMSKSKGNVLDPIDLVDGIGVEELIEKRTKGLMQPKMAEKISKATKKEFPEGISGFGTDALRFTFCALASPTRNINFDTHRLEGYRNFCNKLWNAARFVFMQLEQQDFDLHSGEVEYSLADVWIKSELQRLVDSSHKAFEEYRFDRLVDSQYKFVWNMFCDWYLELTKVVLNDKEQSVELKRGACQTLMSVLDSVLRLLHPVMPFITEEIWQQLSTVASLEGDMLCIQSYPEKVFEIDNKAMADMQWLQQFISEIRNIRGEMGVSPSKQIDVLLSKGIDADKQKVADLTSWLQSLSKVSSIAWVESKDVPELSATGLVGKLEIYVPFADLIDMSAECARLEKEIAKLAKSIGVSEKKLANERFVEKAPKDVVEAEKAKLAEEQEASQKLVARLDLLSANQ